MIVSHTYTAKDNYKQLLNNSARSKVSKSLLSMFEQLESAIKTKKEQGFRDGKYIDDLWQEGRASIINSLKEISEKEKERISKQLEELKEKHNAHYNNNFAFHDFEIRNAERRFKSLSNDELTALGYAVISGKYSFDDPNIADSLTLALAERGLTQKGREEGEPEIFLSELVRESLIKNKYDSPWLRGEQGQALVNELKLNEFEDEAALFQDEETGDTFKVDFNELLFSIAELKEDNKNE